MIHLAGMYYQDRARRAAQVRVGNYNRRPWSGRNYILNHIKNRIPGHVLSNNCLRLCTAAQYVLLFLVMAVNPDWF